VNLNIDVVIPVKMPSEHLELMRKAIAPHSAFIRATFVLDYEKAGEELNPQLPESSSANERILRGEFGSPGMARNAGLKFCDRPYICFWDVDDFPEVIQFEELVSDMRQSQADVAIGNWVSTGDVYKAKGVTPLSVAMHPGIWRIIFRREITERIWFSNLMWGEDQVFLAEILARNPKIITSDRVVYRYSTLVSGSLTSKRSFVQDLPKATMKCLLHLKSSQGTARFVVITMLVKQIVTAIKYGSGSIPLKVHLKSILKTLYAMANRESVFALSAGWRKWKS
jgi:hypothetical protein